jgi:diguanylate cyclase (GGDEF)-like protein/PAS domain S-box-containing protein
MSDIRQNLPLTPFTQGELNLIEAGLFDGGPAVIVLRLAQDGWPAVYASPNLKDQFGYMPQDFLTRAAPFASLIHADDQARVLAEIERHSQAGSASFEQEYRLVDGMHRARWVYEFTRVMRNAQGRITHYTSILMDISPRKQMEDALRASEEQVRTLINTSPEGILFLDPNGEVLMASTRALALFGFQDPTEFMGRSFLDLLDPTELPRAREKLQSLQENETYSRDEFHGVRKDGSRFSFESSAQALKDSLSKVTRILLFNHETTAIRQAEGALQQAKIRWESERLQYEETLAQQANQLQALNQRLESLTTTDDLTGLPNRHALLNIGGREVERALRFNRPLTALCIDIDQLKFFNERHSPAMGDQVLQAVATCCLDILRKVDLVVRTGSDEFTILLPETTGLEATEAAERLRTGIEALRVPMQGITVSIGAAQLSANYKDLETLLLRAAQALVAAKEAGGNCAVISAE